MNGKLKVLVLSPVYPGEGVMKSTTPVVHFFVREWIKQGAEVRVIHYPSNFPWLFRELAKPLQNIISNRLGSDIRTWALKEIEYELDGVKVYRVPLLKLKPHGRYNERMIKTAVSKTVTYCEKEDFKPDVIVSHWVNPSMEVMHHLKAIYHVPTCFVAHDTGEDFKGIYRSESSAFIKETDLLGYRSESIKRRLESNFNCSDKPNFQCYSGIPAQYVEDIHRNINKRDSIIFVGSLIERKYPLAILSAAKKVFETEGCKITYIGTGPKDKDIICKAKKMGMADKVHLLGRIPRNEVVSQMDQHTVFVMISENETFGLVYLEAMARGCITVASRDEGFDGIIQDGLNGFLCKAGNEIELAVILERINEMPQEELQRISDNAVKTAIALTDEKVARNYLNHLKSICAKA